MGVVCVCVRRRRAAKSRGRGARVPSRGDRGPDGAVPDGSGGVRCSLDAAPLDAAPRGVAVLHVLGARWGRVRVVYSIVWSPARRRSALQQRRGRWAGRGDVASPWSGDGAGPVHRTSRTGGPDRPKNAVANSRRRTGSPCGACASPPPLRSWSLAAPRWAGRRPRLAVAATPSDVRSRGHAAQAGSPAPPAPHRCVLKTAREAARATTATRTPRGRIRIAAQNKCVEPGLRLMAQPDPSRNAVARETHTPEATRADRESLASSPAAIAGLRPSLPPPPLPPLPPPRCCCPATPPPLPPPSSSPSSSSSYSSSSSSAAAAAAVQLPRCC